MRSDKKAPFSFSKNTQGPSRQTMPEGAKREKHSERASDGRTAPPIPPDVLSARPLPAGGQCRRGQKRKTLRECFRWVDDAERFAEMSQLQGFATAGGLCARQGSKTRQMAISVESGGVGHPAGRTLHQAPSGGWTMPEDSLRRGGCKALRLRAGFVPAEEAKRSRRPHQ